MLLWLVAQSVHVEGISSGSWAIIGTVAGIGIPALMLAARSGVRVGTLETSVKGVKEDIKDLRGDISQLRTDVFASAVRTGSDAKQEEQFERLVGALEKGFRRADSS